MFKNALVFQIEQWEQPELVWIEQRLDAARFVAGGATDQESAGWVPPRGRRHGVLAESVGGQIILQLCTETRAVPAGTVRTELEAELDRIEQDSGRRPKGRRAREVKEQIVHQLLPRAFPKRANTLVWIDPHRRLVLVGAASLKKADGVLTRLSELLGGGLRMSPLQTSLSPATAMADWLTRKEAPAGFTLDRECELKQPDSEKSAVRYTRHTLDIDEVAAHVRGGKIPTQLAMTWSGRVSFVLNEALALRKIKLLDVVTESAGREVTGSAADKAAAEDSFDADVAIATGELGRLIPDLVEALGGVLVAQPAPAELQPAAAPAAAAEHGVAPWDDLPA